MDCEAAVLYPIINGCSVHFDSIEALKKIADREKLPVDGEILEAIFENSDGDMRKAVNILQSISFIEKPTVKDVFICAIITIILIIIRYAKNKMEGNKEPSIQVQ